MFKIASLSVAVASLLLAMPLIFSSAEAGRIDGASSASAAKADRLQPSRLAAAFSQFPACQTTDADCSARR